MTMAEIGLPEDFDEDDMEVLITGVQNKSEKVTMCGSTCQMLSCSYHAFPHSIARPLICHQYADTIRLHNRLAFIAAPVVCQAKL